MMPNESDNPREPVQGFSHRPNRPANGEWNPYESNWSENPPVIRQAQAVSALAILSMISGIVSIPLICLCFLSLPFSLFAIVAGHISRGIFRRSQGQVTGDGMAVAGLCLGYVSLSIVIGMLVFMFAVGSNDPAMPRPGIAPQWTNRSDGGEGLSTAIDALNTIAPTGNSDTARELAIHLQAALHDIARQMRPEDSPALNEQAESNQQPESNPTEDRDVPAESRTVFAELPETATSKTLLQGLQNATVYCALNDDSCAFLVAIENVSDLNVTDRLTLSQMIWLAAGNSVDEHLNVGEKFAVVLVQGGELQEISLGIYERSDQYDAGLTDRVAGDNIEYQMQLEKFFEPQQLGSEAASGIEESNELRHRVPGE